MMLTFSKTINRRRSAPIPDLFSAQTDKIIPKLILDEMLLEVKGIAIIHIPSMIFYHASCSNRRFVEFDDFRLYIGLCNADKSRVRAKANAALKTGN